MRDIAILLFLLLASPTLLPTSHFPVATAYNNALSLLLWGIFLALLPNLVRNGPRLPNWRQTSLLPLVFILVALGVGMLAHLLLGRYGYLGVSVQGMGVLLITLTVLRAGYVIGWQLSEKERPIAVSFAIAVVAWGAANAVLAWIQYFSIHPPDWWLAPLVESGRVFANLRQPNLLAQVLGLSVFSVLWLFKFGGLNKKLLTLLLLLLVPALNFTGSRMGFLMLLLLPALMAVCEREWRPTATIAIAPILLYVLSWLVLKYVDSEGGAAFYAANRLATVDASGLRLPLWINSWEISWINPIFGCGFGQFNFCLTHANLAARVPATFDHAHNLVLQLLVEFGWLIGGCAITGIAWWVWSMRKNVAEPSQRLALGLICLSLLHAMLEYPWWHLYFLLPIALIAGFASGLKDAQSTGIGSLHAVAFVSNTNAWTIGWRLAGFGACVVAIYFAWTYSLLRPMYVPGTDASPKSAFHRSGMAWLFQDKVEYAHVMNLSGTLEPENAKTVLFYFRHASHGLMDGKFLLRYAQVAAVAGEVEFAHHLIWRALVVDPPIIDELTKVAQLSRYPALLKLDAYARQPYPVTVPMSEVEGRPQ